MKIREDATGQEIEIPDSAAGEFAQRGGYSFAPGAAIPVKLHDGSMGAVPVEQYWQSRSLYQVATQQDVASATEAAARAASEAQEEQLQAEFGEGIANVARAGAEATARGLSLGASDWVMTQLGADPKGLQQRAERNPIAAATGEVVGSVAPMLLTGGTSALAQSGVKGAAALAARATPTVVADAIGAAVGKKVAAELGEGFMARLAAGSANMAAQGALAGIGGEITNRAFEGQALLDPATMDEYLMAAGQGAMIGGAFGAGGHLIGETAGVGLKLGKRALATGKDLYGKVEDMARAPIREAEAGLEAARAADYDAPVRAAEQRMLSLQPEDLSGLEGQLAGARAKAEAAAPTGQVLPGAAGGRADAPLEALGRLVQQEAAALGVPPEAARSAWQRIEDGRRAFETIDAEQQATTRRITALGDKLEELGSHVRDELNLQRRNESMRKALAFDRTAAPPEQMVAALQQQHARLRSSIGEFLNSADPQIKNTATLLDKFLRRSEEEINALSGRSGAEYVYHTTNDMHLGSLRAEGLKPGDGGELLFTKSAEQTKEWNHRFSQTDLPGERITLRTKRAGDMPNAAQRDDWAVTNRVVPPEELEVWADGKWQSLDEYQPRAADAQDAFRGAIDDRAFETPPTARLTIDQAADAFEILDQSNRILGHVRAKMGDRSRLGIGTLSDRMADAYEETRQLLKNPLVVGENVSAISGRAKASWSDLFDVWGGYKRNLLAEDAGGARTLDGFDTVDRFDPRKVSALLKQIDSPEAQLQLELIGRGLDSHAKLMQHFAEDIASPGSQAAHRIAEYRKLSAQIADELVAYRSKAALAREYATAAAPAVKEMSDLEAKLAAARVKAQEKLEAQRAKAQEKLDAERAKSGEVKERSIAKAEERLAQAREKFEGGIGAAILDGALSTLGGGLGGVAGMLGAHVAARAISSFSMPLMRHLGAAGLQGAIRTGETMQRLQKVAEVGRRMQRATVAIGDALRTAKPLAGVAKAVAARAIRDTDAEYEAATNDVTARADSDPRAGYLAAVMPQERQPLSMRPDLVKITSVSPLEKRKFLRAVRAVNDPVSVLEDFARGAGTRESAAALRTLYPALYQRAVGDIMQHAADLKRSPSMSAQRHLSILVGQPLHFTVAPDFVRFTQAAYGEAAAAGQSGTDMLQDSSPTARVRPVNSKTIPQMITPGQKLETSLG